MGENTSTVEFDCEQNHEACYMLLISDVQKDKYMYFQIFFNKN